MGQPDSIDIDLIVWNDETEVHLARHEVAYADILAVLANDPLIFRNLEGRAGSHVLIGPDNRGRILLVSIRRTLDMNVWQPVTAWESRLGRRLWQEGK